MSSYLFSLFFEGQLLPIFTYLLTQRRLSLYLLKGLHNCHYLKLPLTDAYVLFVNSQNYNGGRWRIYPCVWTKSESRHRFVQNSINFLVSKPAGRQFFFVKKSKFSIKDWKEELTNNLLNGKQGFLIQWNFSI